MTIVRALDMSELSEGAVHCRGFGHRWQDHGATRVGKGLAQGWRVTQVCDCCGTMKLFGLDRRGYMEPAKYIYPDNYLARFFVGKEERAAMRLEALADVLGRVPLKIVNGGKS